MHVVRISLGKLAIALALGMEIIRAIPVEPGVESDAEISINSPESQEFELEKNPVLETPSPPATNKNDLKRAGPPGGFYVYTKSISCASADRVRELWDAMANRPVRHARNWRELDIEIGREAVNQIIYETQRRAYDCICSHYPLVGSEGLRLRAISTSEGCKTEEVARMLEKVYGCGCYELYTQKGGEGDSISTGEPKSGLEDSLLLGGVPEGIENLMRTTPLEEGSSRLRGGNKRYKQFNDFHLGGYTADRQLVPGTKEPYWLSGPEELPRSSRWGTNSVKHQLGGLGELYKRAGDIEPRSIPTAYNGPEMSSEKRKT
ncbi:hypothetical protein TWF506_006957 [Arthrobotrys conoides]|uniref:Uncharacterized protein n=1 Tax=Arthrobotrys conoides TaxID=74498 RepID=A0AAN8NI02_9PEZI